MFCVNLCWNCVDGAEIFGAIRRAMNWGSDQVSPHPDSGSSLPARQ